MSVLPEYVAQTAAPVERKTVGKVENHCRKDHRSGEYAGHNAHLPHRSSGRLHPPSIAPIIMSGIVAMPTTDTLAKSGA